MKSMYKIKKNKKKIKYMTEVRSLSVNFLVCPLRKGKRNMWPEFRFHQFTCLDAS